jgi:SAM-dependent methyltransferase
MLMLALPVEMVMVVKTWVWEAPFIGLLVQDAGYLLAAESNAHEVMARGKQHLEQGVSVMVFPEGSRSPDGKMRRFHVGGFKLALETGSDILPILISNSQACIPYKAYWIGDHQVVIRVLPPVTQDAEVYSQGPRELSKQVRKMLLAHVDQDWRLAQDGKAFWHNIRSFYNYRGAFVENYIAWKLRLDPIYRGIDELVPREGTVLDLGSGYGLMSVILARKSLLRQVKGLDLDERKIRVCQEMARSVDNLQFHEENFMEHSLPSADAILMVDTLHYWSGNLQFDAIAKACAALNQQGILVFREACKSNSWKHRITHWGECFSVGTGHNRPGTELCFLSRESYLEVFSQHGLRLVAEPKGLGRGSNTVLVFRKES